MDDAEILPFVYLSFTRKNLSEINENMRSNEIGIDGFCMLLHFFVMGIS